MRGGRLQIAAAISNEDFTRVLSTAAVLLCGGALLLLVLYYGAYVELESRFTARAQVSALDIIVCKHSQRCCCTIQCISVSHSIS